VRRVYTPAPLAPGVAVVLDSAEAHHLRDVLRRKAGDAVEVFDANGRHFRALITRADEGCVELEPVQELGAAAEALAVELWMAVVKGPRFDWLVEKASELGAAKILPLLTERTLAPPGAGRVERWRRLAVAAAKQCGRARPCEVVEAMDLRLACEGCRDPLRLYLDRAGAPLRRLLAGAVSATLAVGPEGGFSPVEQTLLASHGFVAASLAGATLRSETAALAALVIAADCLPSMGGTS